MENQNEVKLNWNKMSDKKPKKNKLFFAYCPEAKKGFELSLCKMKMKKGMLYYKDYTPLEKSDNKFTSIHDWNITHWIYANKKTL